MIHSDNRRSISNTINDQNIFSSHSQIYCTTREREKQEIITKLKAGIKITRYNDNYIELGGKTYNGWSEEDIRKLNIL